MPITGGVTFVGSNAQVGADVVKTGNILDGEIVNADIAAGAAIDLSKVPDAAAEGANSDITSLSGLTTPLSVAQGGTGKAAITAHLLLVGNGTGAPTEVAIGTATHVLTSNGAGGDPTFQAVAGTLYNTASDTLKTSNDTEVVLASATYVKRKEIVVKSTGYIRVKFDLKSSNGGNTAYGKIYKNDVALGTERANASTTYTTHSEDLLFGAGDRLQLYTKSDGGGQGEPVRNLRLYYTEAAMSGDVTTL